MEGYDYRYSLGVELWVVDLMFDVGVVENPLHDEQH